MPEADDVRNDSASQIGDRELRAIQDIISALTNLDAEARKRVIEYVFGRLGLAVPLSSSPLVPPAPQSQISPPLQPSSPSSPRITDIRSLKDQKKPRSSAEMAALVGYYLTELVPTAERKVEVTAQDISKYFKQANFPLPGRPRKTLFDAKNAGYLDAGSKRGGYKLNPVGHNLVVHTLPAAGGQQGDAAQRPRARTRVKRVKKGSKTAPRKKRR